MKTIYALVFLAACSSVKAQSADLPSKMEIGDAARLDRDLQHMNELRAELMRYNAEASEVCSKYRIDPAALGKSVGVDFVTGEIRRQAPKAK